MADSRINKNPRFWRVPLPGGRIQNVPDVSIYIPCYNAVETLDETLDSLTLQTLTDIEVIAVDDGSTDSTLNLLHSWASRDSRIRVISRPHRGVIEAANVGIAACCAPYIARMDADDRAHPERLAVQHDYLESNPETAVVSSLVTPFPQDDVREGYRIYVQWLNSLVSNDDIRREMFVESPMANPSVMVRKSWMEKMGGYQDHGWAEDYDLWLRMYIAGAVFAKIPRVLLEWRDHPNRITRTDSRYSITNFLKAKAYYLARGPLVDRDAVIVWGAGMMGRRLGKHLQSQELPLCAYVDIDPKKIGSTRRGQPIIAPDGLLKMWGQYENPVILAAVGARYARGIIAVGARYARGIIRSRLRDFGFVEGVDWWGAA